ncbi:TPA: esterase family protein [Enterobacter cloacae]|nr:esterase family protein [Enterobacter cloacae]
MANNRKNGHVIWNRRISQLLQQLEEAKINAESFWLEVSFLEVPEISNIPGISFERDVTFLWRASGPLQGVYLRLNRVTDKSAVNTGMMRQVSNTNVWTLTVRLPSSFCGSYSVTEIPAGISGQERSLLGSRFSSLKGLPDPLNRAPGIVVRHNSPESVLSLDHAPSMKEWHLPGKIIRGRIVPFSRCLGEASCRMRLYIPDISPSSRTGLLILPDADIWMDRLGLLLALEQAAEFGRIPPVAVIGIDSPGEAERVSFYGKGKSLVARIADTLLPELRKDFPQLQKIHRSRTVLAGQSLGGILALMGACYASDTFGLVLSHSPSMWWRPGRNVRPVDFPCSEQPWISEQLLYSPPHNVRIHLAVGSLEGDTVFHVSQLHHQLEYTGINSSAAVYTGGHDYAWWRSALIDGLALLKHQP